MEKEIWKDVPGWEGYYQASTLGNIRRISPKLDGSFSVDNAINCKKRVAFVRNGVSKAYLRKTVISFTFLPKSEYIYSLKDKRRGLKVSNFILTDRKCRIVPNIVPVPSKAIPSLEEEKWVHLLDFEGYYMVSNLGRFKKIRVGLDKSIEDIRLIVPVNTRASTNMVYVTVAGEYKSAGAKAASLVFDSFHDDVLRGLPYIFKDGDEDNFALNNLTPRKGVRVGISRRPLPSEIILNKYYKGVYIKYIAEEYGVHMETIRSHIKYIGGKMYKEKGLVEAYLIYGSISKISEDLGLDFDFVKHVLVRHNILNED